MAKAEGLSLPFHGPDQIRPDLLEAIPYTGHPQLITYTTDEFSAVCPYSGLPDLATIVIRYIPSDKLVELKSLKYYFVSFRNVGIYQEDVTAKVFKDMQNLLEPSYLRVYTRYKVRGGIDAECVIETESEAAAVSRYVHGSNA